VPSFTIALQDLQQVGPITELGLAVPQALEDELRRRSEPVPTPTRLLAMIDTGASASVIQQGLATQLGLQPIGTTLINTPSSTGVSCYEYAVRLAFPNNVVVEGTVIEAALQGQHIQALIGRDVLAHGVLVYIGYTGQFTLSF
jgi:hypothetical protein